MKNDPLKRLSAAHTLYSARGVPASALLIATALLLPAMQPSSHAAVTQVWVARYNNVLSNANGVSSKIVRDPAGDIIVAGYAGDGVGGQDMLTIKYSGASGSVLWQRRYNGPAGGNETVQALAVDQEGNVVVSGVSFAQLDPIYHRDSTFDYYTAKYASADGALLWERRYHDPDNSDIVTGLAVDGNGNAVVAGVRHTAKYAAADGALIWVKRFFDPPFSNSGARSMSMALDRSGNVVVMGMGYSSSTFDDIYTVKYAAADGAVLWERRYNSPSTAVLVDSPSAMALDGSGNVVITGYCGLGRDGEFYAAKYGSADGALLWEQLGGLGYGKPTALGLDSSGNVVVAGYSTTGFVAWGWPVFTEFYTAKFAGVTGALVWAKPAPFWIEEVTFEANNDVRVRNSNRYARYASADGAPLSESQLAFPFSAANVTDGSGNVVVTGGAFITTKYVVATGAPIWSQQFVGPVNLADTAQAVAIDGSGNVVVTGSSQSETSIDFYTAKYAAADGALVWERRYNGPANHDDIPIAVAVDGGGNVVVTGWENNYSSNYTAKYASADGSLIWEKRGRVTAAGLAIDGGGSVVLSGTYPVDGGPNDFYVAKYAGADGAVLWEKRYHDRRDSSYNAAAAAVDGDGNVIVTGPGRTVKYAAADGSLLWERPTPFNALAIAVDGGGNVAVCGFYATGLNTGEYETAKYAAADGALLWEKRYHGPSDYSRDQATSVAMDGRGDVVVTGYSQSVPGDNNVCYTAKYAAADGTLLWERRSPIEVSAVAVDGKGDVILAGTAGLTDNSFDYYVAKHATATGALLWEKRYNGPNNGYDFTRTPQPLALGPNGTIALTGYSSAFSDPLILFGGSSAYDYATVVYREAPWISIERVSDSVRLRGFGEPGRVHQLWRSSSVTGRGTMIHQQSMPSAGSFEFTEPSGSAAAFYHMETSP